MATVHLIISETWKDIPEFPGYQVSDVGNVRNFWVGIRAGFLTVARRLGSKPRPVKAHLNPSGYYYVKLASEPGRYHTRLVHRLVLSAFVGPCPERHEGCHRDGSRTNNALSNLYWGTRSDNCLDTSRHGRNRNAKLSPDQVVELVRLHSEGWSQVKLARHFGILQCSVSNLLIHRGIRTCRANLTSTEIREMFRLRDEGWTHRMLANRFGLKTRSVGAVFARWRHKPLPLG
jgi:DNA-directed RNA polymerase specialized sigma24 family protein